MKITDPGLETIREATQGNLAAIDAVLLAVQPGVFNLAVRMLGNREDAADATQEILLKVVTHLGGFRADAAFGTWVFQVARNHLLTAITRSNESPEVSLEGLSEHLRAGLEFGAAFSGDDAQRALTPEDKLAVRQVALKCTQSMLMALDREQRLVYVLDGVFRLSGKDAAEVVGVTPEAYRQRLTRVRGRLDAFTGSTCGLANADAACRCERQLPAIEHVRRSSAAAPASVITIHPVERAEVERQFDALVRMGDAAAIFRAHPEYRVPEAMRGAIRAVLSAEGFLSEDRGRH